MTQSRAGDAGHTQAQGELGDTLEHHVMVYQCSLLHLLFLLPHHTSSNLHNDILLSLHLFGLLTSPFIAIL